MIVNDVSKNYITIKSRQSPFFAPLIRSSSGIDHRNLHTKRGPRILPVLALIEYDDLSHFEKLKEDVAKWLVHEKPVTLKFSDDPDRMYCAVIDNTIEYSDVLPTAADITINFICGYKYSQERNFTISNTLTRTIAGHLPTDWKTKTIFTSNQIGYELQFNAPGKTDLRDINKIKINGEFRSGDVLEIDYSRRKILLNNKDISNQLVIMQSNYAELPVGSVEFEANHKTEVFCHERYY